MSYYSFTEHKNAASDYTVPSRSNELPIGSVSKTTHHSDDFTIPNSYLPESLFYLYNSSNPCHEVNTYDIGHTPVTSTSQNRYCDVSHTTDKATFEYNARYDSKGLGHQNLLDTSLHSCNISFNPFLSTGFSHQYNFKNDDFTYNKWDTFNSRHTSMKSISRDKYCALNQSSLQPTHKEDLFSGSSERATGNLPNITYHSYDNSYIVPNLCSHESFLYQYNFSDSFNRWNTSDIRRMPAKSTSEDRFGEFFHSFVRPLYDINVYSRPNEVVSKTISNMTHSISDNSYVFSNPYLSESFREQYDPSNLSNVENACAGRQYQCSECGRAFSTKSNLKSHMIIHTEDKPHKCPECPMAFVKQEDLIRHIKDGTHLSPIFSAVFR